MAEATVIIFCTQVGYVKSQYKNDKSPLKVVWSWSRDALYFGAPNDISGTAKARIIKFCRQVDCIKS